jgi:type IV fimbrial biogenesis protein FimT
LLELAIALAIAVLLAAMAVPSLNELVTRQRLHAAAEHLRADVALARREAGNRGMPVHRVFRPGSSWCYLLATDPGADCRQDAPPAPGSGVIKRVRGADQPGVLLLAAQAMTVDSRTGGSPGGGGSAQFAISTGQQLLVRLGPLGHASLCASGAPLPGTPACPPATPLP